MPRFLYERYGYNTHPLHFFGGVNEIMDAKQITRAQNILIKLSKNLMLLKNKKNDQAKIAIRV